MVLVPVVNAPAEFVTLPPILSVPDPPLTVPFVLVQAPVIVCVNPVPRCNVPPAVLLVSVAAFKLPVKVAVPADLLQINPPRVVNPAIF